MSTESKSTAVRAVNRGVEETSRARTGAGAGVERLEAVIGNWINEGTTVAGPEHPSQRILISDVYEWAPGERFVAHTASGLIGDTEVGGIEIIGPGATRAPSPPTSTTASATPAPASSPTATASGADRATAPAAGRRLAPAAKSRPPTTSDSMPTGSGAHRWRSCFAGAPS